MKQEERNLLKNIVLLCSAGMSTSMLVTKMRAAAEAEGVACNIDAYGLSEASAMIPSVRLCIIGSPGTFPSSKAAAAISECTDGFNRYADVWINGWQGCLPTGAEADWRVRWKV